MASLVTNVYLAFDKKSEAHVVVRHAYARDEMLHPCTIEVDEFNAFMMAKDPFALIDAVRKFGPMYRRSNESSDYFFTPSAFLQMSEDGLGHPHAFKLAGECYFDPYSRPSDQHPGLFSDVGRGMKVGARRAVDIFDFDEIDFDLTYAGDRYVFCLEPLQDWIVLRNVLSVAMRLAVLVRQECETSDLLGQAGFARLDDSQAAGILGVNPGAYVIPIARNPYGIAASSAVTTLMPFLNRITGERTEEEGYTRWYNPAWEGIDFRALSGAHEKELANWLYLVFSGDIAAVDQAQRFVNALDKSVCSLSLSFDDPYREISAAPYDVPSALWSMMRDSDDLHFMTCKQCGRSLLTPVHGQNRQFCSSACRSTWSKVHDKSE